MGKISYYSIQGLEKLKEELNFLERVERPKIINAISEARDKGDLSENAEYSAAKEEQSLLELRIVNMKNKIANARILDESKLDASKVLIYSTVKIKNVDTKAELIYTLTPETDIKNRKLSVDSPIGKGLLGHKKGDVVSIEIPNGIMKFEIIEISR